MPAALPELLEPETVGRIAVPQEIVAIGVEEKVLPGLDEVDAPEAVLPVQEDGDEARRRARTGCDRVVALDVVFERERSVDAFEPLQLLEARERVLRAHPARALGEERQRRIAGEIRGGAQEGGDRLLHVRRRRVARAPLRRDRALEVGIHRDVRQRGFRAGAA